MTHDHGAATTQRYHDRFDTARYAAMAERLASNLNADHDDARVGDLLGAARNAALELCGDAQHAGAWHTLAVRCGQHFLSLHTIDAVRAFLRPFAPEDIRIDDFDATASAMLCAHTGRDDLRAATAHASGVHAWQGRMACELLDAADALSDAAILLLAHDDDCTIREKLRRGLHRLSSALHEGVRHSDQPARYDFRTTHFPAPPR